jgi:hypothetical protein
MTQFMFLWSGGNWEDGIGSQVISKIGYRNRGYKA